MKKVAITGHDGFLGRMLTLKLQRLGYNPKLLIGDVRDPRTFDPLDHSYDMLFHFGAPSSQVLFKRNADYCADVTINGMRNALANCQKRGVKLIYPSTGLLSHGQSNEYARCKAICEDLARGSSVEWLGLRIFGTYGPGEERKRDFASVPWLFMRDMMSDRQPVIYGDGNQTRDFIYITDTVSAIMSLAENVSQEIVDVGSGRSLSFNEIIGVLNLTLGTNIVPKYIDTPGNYIKHTNADISVLKQFYSPRVPLEAGIGRMVNYVKTITGHK